MLHKGSVNIEVRERQAASNVDSNAILGQEMDSSPEEVRDVSKVLSLAVEASADSQQLELPLRESFLDAAMLSSPLGSLSTPVAGILLLCSPGLLHIYDAARIASRFSAPSDFFASASLQPVACQLPIRDAVIAKLFLVLNDFYTATESPQSKKHPSSVSALIICGQTGLLAVGDQRWEVHLWKLCAEAHDLKCHTSEPTEGGTEMVSKVSSDIQCIAMVRVPDIEERLKECKEGRQSDRKAWEEEKAHLEEKVRIAESEVREMKRRRDEDAKANEKVVRIYAGQEQGWKNEKKKLRREVDLLRRDLLKQEAIGFCSPKVTPSKRRCEKCDANEKCLSQLEGALNEKEFLIMTAMEEARAKDKERNELVKRLSMAKATEVELTEKLAKEVTISTELRALLLETRNKLKETESRLSVVIEELETSKKHLEALSLATENHSAMTKKLLAELEILKQESDDKDEMISTMLERTTVEREEKEDIARELADANSKVLVAEAGTQKWKRLAEETSVLSNTGAQTNRSIHRSHRSLGSRTEFEKVADLQKAHAEEVKKLQSAHGKQIQALENQMKMQKGKVQEASSTVSSSSSSTTDFQDTMTDPAFKAWFEVVKGRYAAQLEEKHWHQIESFERQLRAKDAKLTVFRSKLLATESELLQTKVEIDELKCRTSGKEKGCISSVIFEKKDQMVQSPSDCPKGGEELDSQNSSPSRDTVEYKLRMELLNVKRRLKEQETEQAAAVAKLTENFESELQQKDVQVAVLEAKMCQVQLQLEQAKLANEFASSENLQEKMFLKSIDNSRDLPLEKVLHATICNVAKLVKSKSSEAKGRLEAEIPSLEEAPLEKVSNAVGFNVAKPESKKSNVQTQPESEMAYLEEKLPDAAIFYVTKSESKASDAQRPLEEKIAYVEEPSLEDAKDASLQQIDSEAQRQVEEDSKSRLEELLEQEANVFESAKLLSKLKDMCLKEDKSTAMVQFHKTLEVETCDNLVFSPEHCWLPEVPIIKCEPLPPKKPENVVVMSKIVSSFPKVSSFAKISGFQSRIGTGASTTTHKSTNKMTKSTNKQPHNSPGAISRTSPRTKIDNVLLTQAPSKGTRPARFNMLHSPEENHPQRILFGEEKESPAPAPATSTRNIGPVDRPASDVEKKKTRTRDDIQVLGLALEVRRIEQQLSLLNQSTDPQPSVPLPEKGAPVAKKQSIKRYTGLAGKVSQLAKQIGFTSSQPKVATKPKPLGDVKTVNFRPDPFKSDLCLHKNPLFSQESSTSELSLLQQRAETVGKNLSEIQAKLTKENSPDSVDRYNSTSLFPKGQLVVTVQAHLSQVQTALRSKLAQSTSDSNDSPPLRRFPQMSPKAVSPKSVSPKDNKSKAAFGRRESTRPSKPDAQIRQGARKGRAQNLLHRLDMQLR